MKPAIPRHATPFVLLDDAQTSDAAPARLYTDPVEIVVTRRMDEVEVALSALRTATRGGLHAAGYLAYEAGHALEPGLKRSAIPTVNTPLLWFGLFRRFEEIDSASVPTLLPDPASAWAGVPIPSIAREHYVAAFAEVRALIEAGDIYQANLTFQAEIATLGHPLALYAGLRVRAAAGYGAVVHTGREWFLSLSPELFFAYDGARITARPMKGTAARSSDPLLDGATVTALQSDQKQRAENLMIVDLLRNDLSRVAKPGTVSVPELFHVETYPTVHQMTSTVVADSRADIEAVDILAALFPCGSITGAPKIRAMEAIGEIEARHRGIYTGSIGRIDAGGSAAMFNVAIRTLHWTKEGATLGLGSGIVADSQPEDEWSECLAKGNFVASDRLFDLIETMAFDPKEGIPRLELHLERLRASAHALGFRFDRHAARNELQAATFRLRGPARIRLLLSKAGAVAIETRSAPVPPSRAVPVQLVPIPVERDDFRLCHKTTDRRFYDRSRSETFEIAFTDPEGFLTEGSFTNIFLRDGDTLLTPPLHRGILAGVLRQELLDNGSAREADLRPDDLRRGFLIGNSLRGLLPATLVAL